MVFELAEGGDLFQFLCAAPGQRVEEEEGRSLFRQVRKWCFDDCYLLLVASCGNNLNPTQPPMHRSPSLATFSPVG